MGILLSLIWEVGQNVSVALNTDSFHNSELQHTSLILLIRSKRCALLSQSPVFFLLEQHLSQSDPLLVRLNTIFPIKWDILAIVRVNGLTTVLH